MRIKLISSKLCPYAQRSAIVLIHKGVPHDIDYIDLSNPPADFQAVSPLKKVPALLADGRAFFGSTVINEFLEDQFAPSLHPADALARAVSRSWIEFGGECIGDIAGMMLAKTEAQALAARDALLQKFDRLEQVVGDGPYFDGAAFSLVDAGYAPAFQRLDYLDAGWPGAHDARRHPKIAAWRTRLLQHDAVIRSTVPDLPERFAEFIRKREGYVGRFL
ncbi:glutathione S-transferase family protein [Pseudoduganella chitinolytica]|uniref:Glutathione S-transferase family protein n=1 Tax=Pseudoduganella chitinolytica TaxID=34070 RepID=A0ABY8B6I3_9BURK|nr:glutathione S-transferase family protein [Pseudoduganella chitinolytica]WEF31547.1 glutathione S-transferase family protein [Pseudoduganella chitinolytica]